MDILNAFKEDVMSLRNICMTAVAARLWDSPTLRREIANTWNENNVHRDFTLYRYPNYFDVHNEVEEKVLQLPVPKKLHDQLKDYVIIMGYKLTEFIFYVTWELKLDISYIDKVYWTWLGTIDIDKIYYSYWKKKPDFMDPSVCVKWNGIPLVYLMAGILGDEEDMRKYQHIIREMAEKKDRHAHIEKTDDIEYTAVLSLYLYRPTSYPPQGPHYSRVAFFEYCQKLRSCMFGCKTAQYIWKKMDKYERELIIEDILNEEMLYYYIHGETFYHVINDMDKNVRNNFLKKKHLFIMDEMKLDWPYSKLLLLRYDADWEQANWAKKLFIHIVRCLMIIEEGLDDGGYLKPAAFVLNTKLFLKIWNKLTKIEKLKFFNLDYKSLKKKVDISKDLDWRVLLRCYPLYYPCLERIVHDPDVQSLRERIEGVMFRTIMQLLEDDDGLEDVDFFLRKVFPDDEERKRIEVKFNLAVRKEYKLKFPVDYKLFKTYNI